MNTRTGKPRSYVPLKYPSIYQVAAAKAPVGRMKQQEDGADG